MKASYRGIGLCLPLAIAFSCIVASSAAGSTDARAQATVEYIDHASQRFLQSPALQQESLLSEVSIAAATAVLLGAQPTKHINSYESEKLEALLAPKPFHRPEAVASVLISGCDGDAARMLSHPHSLWRSLGIRSGKHLSQALTDIVKINKEGVKEVPLTGAYSSMCDAPCLKRALGSLARATGGAFTAGQEPLEGVFKVQLGSRQLELDLGKDADFILATELASFWHAVQVATSKGAESNESSQPAQLYTATLNGLQAMSAFYENDPSKLAAAVELVVKVVHMGIAQMQEARGGYLTGQVAYLGKVDMNSQEIIMPAAATIAAHRRRLAASLNSTLTTTNATAAELAHNLVNKSVAWGTGILLLITLLISVCCLFGMPVTKDTLLYSRAKID